MSSISPELIALQRAVAGRYSIVRELGRGGMGIVFLARDASLERPVAIKLLPPMLALDTAHRARFVREARTAAALSHPNIVPIHAVEEHHDLAFFVMGFIDGETLAARVARSGPLRIGEAARITQEIAWALAHAHAHGVIHRDIKPDNILIERESGRAIVTDFGIAHVDTDAAASGAGSIVGTPRYMSPEQSRGEVVDARSDLYSLGAVAYLAVTGRPPIDGDSAMAILARKAIVAPAPLATMRDGVPPKLAAAIDRCLARDADARWESAEAFAVAVRATTASKEIAPPIRAFLREADQAGSEIGTALAASAVSIAMTVVVAASAIGAAALIGAKVYDGFDQAFVEVMYFAASTATAGLAGLRIAQLIARARRLIQSGYGHSAVRPALLAAAIDGDGDVRVSSRRSTAAEGVLAILGTAGSLYLGTLTSAVLPIIGFAGSVAIPTLFLRRLFVSRSGEDSRWSRMLRGRMGRALFRIAAIGLRERPVELPAAGEPTSVALRSELTALFDALPGAQRSAFGELPDLALRLERQAAILRDRTPDPETDRRLQSVVAALELLRLDLLRLSTADADTSDLTRDLEQAKRVSEDIEARLQANVEVNRLLSSDSP
jgi:serine/threonine-protein kinase